MMGCVEKRAYSEDIGDGDRRKRVEDLSEETLLFFSPLLVFTSKTSRIICVFGS